MILHKVRLVSPNTLVLKTSKLLSPQQLQHINLLIDHLHLERLKLDSQTNGDEFYEYTLFYPKGFPLGHAYMVVIEGFEVIPVNMKEALHFSNFHQEYTYAKDDLGYVYTTQLTTFKLWAPLASEVKLIFYSPERKITAIYAMDRIENGVYRFHYQGNCANQWYRFAVVNHGIYQEVIDPYGKGLSRNSEFSVVVDFDSLKIPMHDDRLPPFKHYQDAIVYEAHVRDLSSDHSIPFQYPGTFLGAIQPNLKTPKGYPVGFDYLTNLGITHLQLLPINDYRSVNEFDILHQYNWGYDPYHYFCLEGSYASQPDDPLSRIRDFLQLVSHYHHRGIRINIDVVFNHIYDYQHSIFEKIVPGYYFRKNNDGTMSNGSFCGNDLATDLPMVRHLIVQAATFMVKTYHLDGFRFDLMGIIDRITLNEIELEIKRINPAFMFYGEGWNMPTNLPMEAKGITENSYSLPAFAFFNDLFRNTIKGGNSEHDVMHPGFATGTTHASGLIPHLLLGSAYDHLGERKVHWSHQSINYVECHDNNTFFDKLNAVLPHEDIQLKFKRILLASFLIIISEGIPFFHMAQEVGGTKLGQHNSFQAGDEVNQFKYSLLDEREWLVHAHLDLLKLRKKLRENQPHAWNHEYVQFKPLDHGAYLVIQQGKETYYHLFNPSRQTIPLPDEVKHKKLVFDGKKLVSTLMLPLFIDSLSCLVMTSL